MPVRVDITGQRFGRLKVTGRSIVSDGKNSYWDCICDCGTTKVVCRVSLVNGTQSCGCISVEETKLRQTIHGMSGTRVHRIWQKMIQRCTLATDKAFHRYGGRGISVCDEWIGPHGFMRFMDHMGPRPSPQHSVDRIDNDGNYCPENCRWATRKEQARNKSTNVLVTIDGVTKCIAEWAEHFGITNQSMRKRMSRH